MFPLSMAWALRVKKVPYKNVPVQHVPVKRAVIFSVVFNKNAVYAVTISVPMWYVAPGEIVGFSLKKPALVIYVPRMVL